MISKLLNAIKRIFGSADYDDFEDAQTDPGVPTPAPAPVAKAPPAPEITPSTFEAPPAVEDAPTVVPAPVAAAPRTPVTLKGIEISDSGAVLAFANGATKEALKAAGVKGAGLKALLGARPIPTPEALGTISGFGKKSIESLANATR
jgi:hypothetical protein